MSPETEDATNNHFPVRSIDIHVGWVTFSTGFPLFPVCKFPLPAIVFRYTAPSLVATYKYFPFGEPAMAVGDPGALIVELATLLTFPEATANAPIVPLLAFET